VASRPLHSSISLLASSLAVFTGVSQAQRTLQAAASSSHAPSPTAAAAATTTATELPAYRALLGTSSALANAVVSTLGPGNAQPLTPLELSLRLVAGDILEVALGPMAANGSTSSTSSGSGGVALPPTTTTTIPRVLFDSQGGSTEPTLLHGLYTSLLAPLARDPPLSPYLAPFPVFSPSFIHPAAAPSPSSGSVTDGEEDVVGGGGGGGSGSISASGGYPLSHAPLLARAADCLEVLSMAASSFQPLLLGGGIRYCMIKI
jgi:hypothetical protein